MEKEDEHWNIECLFWLGAVKVLQNELLKLDYDIVALPETRLESAIQNLITLHYLIANQKA